MVACGGALQGLHPAQEGEWVPVTAYGGCWALDGVPMEVQIRTRKMHWIAEYGVAAHWRYKEAVDEHVSQAQQVHSCCAGVAMCVFMQNILLQFHRSLTGAMGYCRVMLDPWPVLVLTGGMVALPGELPDGAGGTRSCRPSGSPPKDSSFLKPAHGASAPFPTHDSGCKFADYFQRCARCASLLAAR